MGNKAWRDCCKNWFLYVILYTVFLSVSKFTKRKCLVPQHRAALCWQWCTVGFHRATGGGWVHTVNYTSHPFVWFIALITVGSLKKEKGEEAYKIKKRLKVPQWQREGENCVRVHVGAVGLREPGFVYRCKLLWGSRSQLTVATTERRWRHRTSEHSAWQRVDGTPAAAPPEIGLICCMAKNSALMSSQINEPIT